MAFVTFNTKEHPFFDELKKRVDEYFEKTGKSQWGNWKIYLKTGILLSTMVGMYIWLVFFTPGILLSIALCTLLGFTLAGIGFNVMHDSAHGSFSKYTWINNMMGYSLNLLGGDVNLWKTKHNLVHHSFTNIEGMDDDIDIKPVMRLNLHQKRYWIHRFQHIYAFIFYATNYLFWVYYFDYKKYFSGKIGTVPIRKFPLSHHIIFWVSKVVNLLAFVIVPMWFAGVVPTLIGYGIVTLVCGTVIAIVFQLAHIVEETHFDERPTTNVKYEKEWAVHQIATTSNFATGSKLVHWFTGGLNHQVEHHLFPRISHVHYPALSVIVRETCEKFGITYHEHRTVMQAVRSHVVHLRDIGRA